MTRTHKIVKDEEQRRLNEFRQKIIDRQSARYKKKLADELNADLECKLAVVNIIWISILFSIFIAYCVYQGYSIPFLTDESSLFSKEVSDKFKYFGKIFDLI